MDSLPQEVRDVTSRLSADYLIHDLQTGHFVTVLRFISPLMVRLAYLKGDFINCWQQC